MSALVTEIGSLKWISRTSVLRLTDQAVTWGPVESGVYSVTIRMASKEGFPAVSLTARLSILRYVLFRSVARDVVFKLRMSTPSSTRDTVDELSVVVTLAPKLRRYSMKSLLPLSACDCITR